MKGDLGSEDRRRKKGDGCPMFGEDRLGKVGRYFDLELKPLNVNLKFQLFFTLCPPVNLPTLTCPCWLTPFPLNTFQSV